MFKKLLAAAALTVCTATVNAGVITQSFWFGDDNTTGAQALVVTTGGGYLNTTWNKISNSAGP